MADPVATDTLLRGPVRDEVAVDTLAPPNRVDPFEEDAQATRLVSTSLQRGLRSSVISLGATANALAGAVGQAAGLDEFARSRLAEARRFNEEANQVGPRVRDYRTAKDFADIIDYVAGHAGQAVGSSLPAIGLGAVGGAMAGLRGAATGAFAGSFVPESGEQVLRTVDEPGTPQKKLGLAVAKGAGAAALDVASLGTMAAPVVSRAARKGALPRSMAVEGGTETVQESLGQAAHTLLNPDRPKGEDEAERLNALFAGIIGGGTLGAAPAAVGAAADYASKAGETLEQGRQRTAQAAAKAVGLAGIDLGAGDLRRPPDPDAMPGPDVPDDGVEAWVDQHDASMRADLTEWWDRVKGEEWAKSYAGWEKDTAKMEGFAQDLRERYDQVVTRPRFKALASDVKRLVDMTRGDPGQASLQRTALDLAIFDNLAGQMDPEVVKALSPAERMQLAADVKQLAMYYSFTEDAEGPPDASGMRPRRDVQLPTGLMDLLGPQLPAVLSSTQKILMQGGLPMGQRDLGKAAQQAIQQREARVTDLEQVVIQNLDEKYWATDDPRARERQAKDLTGTILRAITNVRDWRRLNGVLNEAFGPRAPAVLAAFEAQREATTRGWEDIVDESEAPAREQRGIAERLAQNEAFRVRDESERAVEQTPEEFMQEKKSPFRDPRLGVPIPLAKVREAVAELRASGYPESEVSFRAEPVMNEKGEVTDMVTLEAVDPEAVRGFTDEQWDKIRESETARVKGDVEHGVLRVVVADPRPENPNRVKVEKVSIPNLVAEVTRERPGSRGGRFTHQTVLRAIAELMNDPKFVRWDPRSASEVGFGLPAEAMVTTRYNPKTRAREPYTWRQVVEEERAGRQAEAAELRAEVAQDLAMRMGEARRFATRAGARAAKRGEDAEAARATAMEEFMLDSRYPAYEGELSAAEFERVRASKDEKALEEFIWRYYQATTERDEGVTMDRERMGMVGTPAMVEAERRVGETERVMRDLAEARKELRAVQDTMGKKAEAGLSVGKELYQQGQITRKLQALDKKFRGLSTTQGRVGASSTMREEDAGAKPRTVQEETGLPLHARPRRDKSGAQPSQADRAKAGPVKVTKPERKKALSEVRLGAQEISDAQKAEVKAELERLLGPDVQVLFKRMRAAGAFEKDVVSFEEQVLINLFALDPNSVGYHEAAHALLSRLRDHDVRAANTLVNAASSPKVMAQLRRLLADEPEALAQLKNPDERVTYMYQFWARGQLEIGSRTEGLFERVRRAMRSLVSAVTGWTGNPDIVEDAEKLITAFHSGAFAARSSVAQAVAQVMGPKKTQQDHWVSRTIDFADRIWSTVDGRIRGFEIPALTGIMNKFHVGSNVEGEEAGLLQTRHTVRARFLNRLDDIVGDMSPQQQEAVVEELRSGQVRTDRASELKDLLDQLWNYMEKRGVKVVVWNPQTKKYDEVDLKKVENYFPRAYNREAIVSRRLEFVALLKKHKVANPDATTDAILNPTRANPVESDMTAGLTHFAPNTLSRTLGEIPDAELAPFLRSDLMGVLHGYIHHAVRRAEYTKRFGNQGQKIGKAVELAKEQGATTEQVKEFNDAVRAMEGTLGNEIDPKLRGFMTGVMTYQNIRLLPLALFSSLLDSLGIAVRGGGVDQAAKTFYRGVRELFKDIKDDDREFARTIGAVMDSQDEFAVAEMYSMNPEAGWAKWLNDKLFQLNGMESWNRSMRIGASVAARDFIIRHATRPTEHSDRWLAELGLKADDVRVTNGELELTPQVVDALNRWVDGAVLRPHAAIRPAWMSDPHFMLIAHLKQFTYSFQKTIMDRVATEALHGNYRPMLVLSAYVPSILASDILRAAVTPGGADDARMAKWDLQDWISHGVKRAGITGPGQYASDFATSLGRGGTGAEAILGPTGQQLVELMRNAMRGDIGRDLLRAIPPMPVMGV